jgi:hypothetical protein
VHALIACLLLDEDCISLRVGFTWKCGETLHPLGFKLTHDAPGLRRATHWQAGIVTLELRVPLVDIPRSGQSDCELCLRLLMLLLQKAMVDASVLSEVAKLVGVSMDDAKAAMHAQLEEVQTMIMQATDKGPHRWVDSDFLYVRLSPAALGLVTSMVWFCVVSRTQVLQCVGSLSCRW